MAWKPLPTNYTDRTWVGLQKYVEIQNDDDTVSFQDVTPYQSKEKSFFGAYDANRMNQALNIIMSMIENGTNLYEEFLEYFELQEELFEEVSNGKLADYDSELSEKLRTAQTNLEDFLEYMQTKENDADILMATFRQYVNDFRTQYEDIIEEVEQDYENDMTAYKQSQQNLFDLWFQYMRGQLSEDAAGHLQNEIDDLKGALIMIRVKVQSYLIGKTLTCTDGTITKSITVDESGECQFDFPNPGIYSLTDNFTGNTQIIKAYHYGLYPIDIKIALITVNCPSYMIGKKVMLRYADDAEEGVLAHINDYTQSADGTTPIPEEELYYEKIVGEDGKAIFGVNIFGKWLVSNNYTDEKEILDIEDYISYSVNLHVATLTVRFDTSYEGKSCSISSSKGAYSQVIDETGVVTFAVPKFERWLITNSKTFDTSEITINEYKEYTEYFGIAKAIITFSSDIYIGETVTARYKTYSITAEIDENRQAEIEFVGLAEWKITNSRNGIVININADEYKTYEYEVKDLACVGGFVGQFVNK